MCQIIRTMQRVSSFFLSCCSICILTLVAEVRVKNFTEKSSCVMRLSYFPFTAMRLSLNQHHCYYILSFIFFHAYFIYSFAYIFLIVDCSLLRRVYHLQHLLSCDSFSHSRTPSSISSLHNPCLFWTEAFSSKVNVLLTFLWSCLYDS